MLKVKTIIKPSKIQGIGLFADQNISEGNIVWQFNPVFDLVFSTSQVVKMASPQKLLIQKYAFLSKVSGKYIYSADNCRFMNHSANNYNIVPVQDRSKTEFCAVANRDIKKGEELLIDYRQWDANDEKSKEKYLKSSDGHKDIRRREIC